MTQDDIIRMALEAGWTSCANDIYPPLEKFAALVAAAEREACAKVCDGWMHANGDDCAEAIRARNTQE